MKESQFVRENHEDWSALEELLKRPTKDADELQRLFVKISSDLSYARSFFPRRSVTVYLNNLTQEVFDSIRSQEEKFSFSMVVGFFRRTLPYEIYRSRTAFLVSFLVFTTAVLIGVISTANNEDFLTVILGEAYVEMTEDNINDGDPMAVYKQTDSSDMFLGITLNNIRVAFFAFVAGLAGIFGTILILIKNGIMLGAFQYFFYAKGLFVTSFLTIWIHGTIEISAIIIAGAAGIVLGQGLLFPGTYSRAVSLQISAQRGIRILLGTVPLFIIAGFLESFVTRLTELPTIVKVAIIGGSAALILVQFVIYPIIRYRKGYFLDPDLVIEPSHFVKQVVLNKAPLNFAEIVSASLSQYRDNLGKFMRYLILPGTVIFAFIHYLAIRFNIDRFKDLEYAEDVKASFNIHSYADGGLPLFIILSFGYCLMYIVLKLIFEKQQISWRNLALYAKYFGAPILVATTLYQGVAFLMAESNFRYLVYLLIPLHFVYVSAVLTNKGANPIREIIKNYQFSMTTWLTFVPYYLFSGLLILMLVTGLVAGLSGLIVGYFTWHNLFELERANAFFYQSFFEYFMSMLLAPFLYAMFVYRAKANDQLMTASDLNERFTDFGTNSSVFEKQVIAE